MARIRFLLVLAVLLLGGLLALPAAQTLSSQVLQLLTRVNTWTGRQTFQDLRLSSASPSDTNQRLYNISGGLYWNGALVVSGGGGGAVHNILSASHGDATVATVTRGGLIVGQGGSPTWSLLTVGAAGTFLRSDGTDVAWGTDGSGLTSLNAGALASGTVPLARISGLTNAQIDGAAAIAWSKINTAGSSLANLTTRSASDLDSGTLADARLSANVSLFGTSVQTAEILDGTILFADWAANGCTSGQYPQYNGATWICSTVTPGSGTVTSVGLTLPAIFSVSGSPVTGSGTLAGTLASQSANLVWAGPSSGGAAAPTFRSLVYDDFPTSAAAAGTYPKVTINNKGIVTGTANQITLTTDVTGTLPLANGGTGLNAAADDSVLLSNGTAWSAAALTNCTTGLTYATASNTFGCSSTGTTHDLLSATHADTLAASPVAGDLITASGAAQWSRLAIGAAGTFLSSSGTAATWTTTSTIAVGAAHSIGVRNTSNSTAATAALLVGNDLASNQLELRSFSSTYPSAANTGLLLHRGTGGLDIAQVGATQDIRFYTNTSTLGLTLDQDGKSIFLDPFGIAPSIVFSTDLTTGFTPITRGVAMVSNSAAVASLIGFGATEGNALLLDSAAVGTGLNYGGYVEIGRNSSGSGAPGSLRMRDRTGVAQVIWVDSTGVARVSTATPSESSGDTGGTIIGTQTSTRTSKDILTRVLDTASALQLLRDTPVYTFRYKNGAYNREVFTGITTEDSPQFGMDQGKSFNPVSAFGYSILAMQELAARLEAAERRIAELEHLQQVR